MVPCDQIYNYLLNLSKTKTLVYFLKTFQTRNLDDFTGLYKDTGYQRRFRPVVIAHDQEMLDFDRYLDHKIQEQRNYLQQKDSVYIKNLNLRWLNFKNVHDHYILTHSELNSDQVEKYQKKGFVPVYFWSHAMIARDWYRYAEHDPLLNLPTDDRLPLKDFLIYSRGWKGSREYRLKFAEILLEKSLQKDSIYRISYIEDETYLPDYHANDQRFSSDRLSDIVLHISDCSASGDASATYDTRDFQDTGISIVLETNFADPRIHLTEKILRPIALGHPFMLASSSGCLEYLRSYGFETFENAGIDESYDLEPDPVTRLRLIANEMERIQQMSDIKKRELYLSLRQVAKRNRERFFSQGFYDQVTTELRENYLAALEKVTNGSFGKLWLENRRLLRALNGPDHNIRGRQLKNLSVIRRKRVRARSRKSA